MKNILFLLILLTGFFANSALQTQLTSKIVLGVPSSSDKTIEFNNGAGTANPKIKMNSSTSKLQYAHDGATFSDFGAEVSSPMDIKNIGFSATIASNDLTIAIKQADGATNCSISSSCSVSFPNISGGYTVVSITGAISLKVSNGSTLGLKTGTNYNIYIYLINNSGTAELAVSALYKETYGEISTAAEGGAGAADTYNSVYSTTARSNVPYILIGKIVTAHSSGAWSNSITSKSVVPFPSTTTITGSILAYRFETAKVYSLCSSTPCTISEATSGITSITRAATGSYTINFEPNIFAGTPACFFSSASNAVAQIAAFNMGTATSSAISFTVATSSTGAAADGYPMILCFGPRY